MRTALIVSVSVLALSACQTIGQSAHVERDSLGNIYPQVCRGSVVLEGYYHVLNGARGYVEYRPREKMPRIPGTTNGFYTEVVSTGSSVSSITIADDDTDREDSIKHALCHALAGKWHDSGGLAERLNAAR